MTTTDCALAVLEAAYSPIAETARWAATVACALSPLLPGESFAYVVRGRELTTYGLSRREKERVAHDKRTLPRAVFAALNGPSPPVDTNARRIAKIQRAFGPSLRRARRDTDLVPIRPFTGIAGTDADGEGIVVGVFGIPAIAARTRHVLSQIAAHLAAASRLRHAIIGGASHTTAVCSPDGNILDAEPPAARDRASLALAVRRMERARSVRGLSREDALASWTALVEGRYTLVDHIESDGKRLVLARANPVRTTIGGLRPREGAVATLAALGHSDKYIAYELGLERSTVASHLMRALRKLGLRDRRELVRTFGPLARAP